MWDGMKWTENLTYLTKRVEYLPLNHCVAVKILLRASQSVSLIPFLLLLLLPHEMIMFVHEGMCCDYDEPYWASAAAAAQYVMAIVYYDYYHFNFQVKYRQKAQLSNQYKLDVYTRNVRQMSSIEPNNWNWDSHPISKSNPHQCHSSVSDLFQKVQFWHEKIMLMWYLIIHLIASTVIWRSA